MTKTRAQQTWDHVNRSRMDAPTVRWWIGTDPDPDKRTQIVVTATDAAKKPGKGDETPFQVTDLLTGKRFTLRRADCGLGCQCALEFVTKDSVCSS